MSVSLIIFTQENLLRAEQSEKNFLILWACHVPKKFVKIFDFYRESLKFSLYCNNSFKCSLDFFVTLSYYGCNKRNIMNLITYNFVKSRACAHVSQFKK